MNKPSYPHPFIAREGWPFIAGIVLVSVLITFWSVWASLPFGCSQFLWCSFFVTLPGWHPTATTTLSPADGRIVAVEETHDPYADRRALKISVS